MGEKFESMDGALRKNMRQRWTLNDIELTCGSCLQVKIQNQWIDVVIEHDCTGYYAIPSSIKLHEGLCARFPSQWGE